MKKYNQKEIEKKVSQFWKKEKIPEKSLAFRKGRKKFYFIDGPPYASGSIHLGTALNKILKDYFVRYKKMSGFNVRYQPGYDTHGLPIERKVQDELGLKGKEEIKKMGVAQFNKKCREFATRHIDDMTKSFSNLAIWMDWKNPYLTLTNDYIESAWDMFKTAHEKGFLFRDVYPVHICGRCGTVVAYNEIDYDKVTDTSILVKFKVNGKDNEHLVIWTTTPWTLFANTGIMVHPNFEYAKVKVGNDTLIIAKELVDDVVKICRISDYKILETFKGKKLEGTEYENPLKDMVPLQGNIKPRVICSSQFVTLEQGTGLVHTAPGHGLEDYKAGKENNLDIVCPVDVNGEYDETAGKYKEMYVKDCDAGITEDLEVRDALLGSFPVKHDYPMCWRCKSPLLQVAIPQWFFKVTKIREKLIKENKKVNWIPDFAGKRFGDWLENLGDWPITRQRYWGIPAPIWKCGKCSEIKVIGSADELPKKVKDLHMPYIDKIKLKCKCGGVMVREPEVVDVWFDSSICSWASLGYPKNKKLFNEMWPPDINIEARDQIRGWWNSQLISSVIMFDKKPYEAILMHGFVMDLGGVKLSKSKGAKGPEEITDAYGVDVFRAYLLSVEPGKDFFFDIKKISEFGKFLGILWNTKVFIDTYGKQNARAVNLNADDKWMLSRINSVTRDVTAHNDAYCSDKAVDALNDFLLNEFSRWYIKLIRERTRPTYDGRDREGAQYALNYVMEKLLLLLAPANPHITEYLHGMKKSIHLEAWPSADEKLINKELEKNMKVVMDLSEAVNALRQENNIKLRHPVKRIVVAGNAEVINAVKEMHDVIAKICNAKEVETGTMRFDLEIMANQSKLGPKFGKDMPKVIAEIRKSDVKKLKKDLDKGSVKVGKYKIDSDMVAFIEKIPEGLIGKRFAGGCVYLDIEKDEALIEESLIKELVRKVQMLRKKQGRRVNETIDLYLDGENELLKKYKSEIESGTSSRVSIGKLKGKEKDKLEFEGKIVKIKI